MGLSEHLGKWGGLGDIANGDWENHGIWWLNIFMVWKATEKARVPA